jgi:hypothetical protein
MRGISFIALVSVLGLVAPACGAFGESSDDGAPVSAARSIQCGTEACSGEDFCCLNGDGATTCAPSCEERTFACNDLTDCASGLVCCVDVLVVSSDAATVNGATCRAEADCQPTQTDNGPTRLRGCSLRGTDCNGKGCAELTSRYPTVFPSSHVFVCD